MAGDTAEMQAALVRIQELETENKRLSETLAAMLALIQEAQQNVLTLSDLLQRSVAEAQRERVKINITSNLQRDVAP